jgi:hypothetical protein
VPTSTGWNTTSVGENPFWRLTGYQGGGDKYRTLSDWIGYFGTSYTVISAIELGIGSSTSTTVSTGSVDWIEYSILSSGTLITEKVDFAAPIPEPATAAALLATCGLGVALVARRRKQLR